MGDLALARGAARVPAHDRAREPGARAPTCAATRAGSTTTSTACISLFPRLKEREKQKGGTMSGGEQQMLAIGRALMANPKLLLLDEPSMGIAPILVERIYETIAEINRQGTTILLVEQNANYRARRLQARLRAGDRSGRARGQVERAADQPRSPEGIPGRMTMLTRSHRSEGAVAHLSCGWPRRSSPPTCPARKGYGEKLGPRDRPAAHVLGAFIWPVWPPRETRAGSCTGA